MLKVTTLAMLLTIGLPGTPGAFDQAMDAARESETVGDSLMAESRSDSNPCFSLEIAKGSYDEALSLYARGYDQSVNGGQESMAIERVAAVAAKIVEAKSALDAAECEIIPAVRTGD